jgi:uncharacterized protein (DUF2267 family)
MSANGLPVFDKTVHMTNIWLNEIMDEIGPDRQLAWHVLTVVLHAIRDELPVEDAAHLSAQLPLLVRGAFYAEYTPARQPMTVRHLDEFLGRIAEGLAFVRPLDPELAVVAVAHVLNRHVTPGEIRKARLALPEAVRRLWPPPSRAEALAEGAGRSRLEGERRPRAAVPRRAAAIGRRHARAPKGAEDWDVQRRDERYAEERAVRRRADWHAETRASPKNADERGLSPPDELPPQLEESAEGGRRRRRRKIADIGEPRQRGERPLH